jgi:uncharacterized BrkB/YihY/UPF0761 family membrane protein
MKEDQKILKALIIGMLITTVVICGISFFFFSYLEFYMGVFIGVLTAILQVMHINHSINKALDRTPEEGQKYVVKRYFMRYIVIILIMVFGILYSPKALMGIVVGLFTLKIAAYLLPWVKKYMK